jgi:hypothetical protein
VPGDCDISDTFAALFQPVLPVLSLLIVDVFVVVVVRGPAVSTSRWQCMVLGHGTWPIIFVRGQCVGQPLTFFRSLSPSQELQVFVPIVESFVIIFNPSPIRSTMKFYYATFEVVHAKFFWEIRFN